MLCDALWWWEFEMALRTGLDEGVNDPGLELA